MLYFALPGRMPGQGEKREATPYHDSGKKQKSETLCPTLGLSFRLRTESEAEADLHKYKYALNEVAKGEDPFHECEEELEEYKQVRPLCITALFSFWTSARR